MRIILLLSLLLCSACAVKVQLPENSFLIPEVSGQRWKGAVHASSYGAPEVTLASDTFSNTPDTTPTIDTNIGLSVGAQLGIAEKIDVYYTAGLNTASFFGAQWQFYGDTLANSKSGNLSLSVVGGLALGSAEEDGTLGDIQNNVEIDYNGWEARLLAGYRLGSYFLLHSSLFYMTIDLDNQIRRTESGTTALTADTKGQGTQYGVGLGLRSDLWESIFADIRMQLIQTTWKRETPSVIEVDESQFVAGVNLGFRW